jgi:hypothetical protein
MQIQFLFAKNRIPLGNFTLTYDFDLKNMHPTVLWYKINRKKAEMNESPFRKR